MSARLIQTGFRVLLAAVLLGSSAPPPVKHVHSEGKSPHQHGSPDLSVANHKHRHPHPHTHSQLQAPGTAVRSLELPHSHWSFLGFDLFVPPLPTENSDDDQSQPNINPVRVCLSVCEQVGRFLDGSPLADGWTASSDGQPDVAVAPAAHARERRTCAALPLCDSARLVRSGVQLT